MAARPNQRTARCLNDLPDEVFHEILSRLHIRDAARSSAVCRAWRHRWRHLSNLRFASQTVGAADLLSVAQSVLLRHLGPVRKFGLIASGPPLPATGDRRIDDLVGHLAHPRHGLLVLCLWVPRYRVHSSIFSCIELVALRLRGCLLPNLTPEFDGLPKLLDLYVHYPSTLKQYLNSGQLDILGALISGSPSLGKLDLTVESDVPGLMLKISAPRLRHMVIESWSADWMVEFQSQLPIITSAKLRLPVSRYIQEGGSKLVHILQSISRVEKLELLDASRLDNFQDMMPIKIPVTFEKLQYFSTNVDLGCAPHITFVLHLLRSCPNIREFEIKRPASRTGFQDHFQADQDFWNLHAYGGLFPHLWVMKLIDVFLSPNELHFIKLVLSNAELLENFFITHHAGHESSSLEACIEIMKFKRASRLAQINYKVSTIS